MRLYFSKLLSSIITRILILTIILMTIGTSIRYYTVNKQLRGEFEKIVISQQIALAKSMASSVSYKITQRKEFINKLSSAIPIELLKQPEKLTNWIKERQEIYPIFSNGIFVISSQGTMVAGYPYFNTEKNRNNFSNRDYFNGALKGNTFVSKPILGKLSSEYIILVSTPIRDVPGNIIGIMVGATSLKAPGFLDMINHGKIGETGGYLLISKSEQIFIAASKEELILKPTAKIGVNKLHDKAMSGINGSGITKNAQGIKEVASFQTVPNMKNWFVVSRIPTKEAFSVLDNWKELIVRSTVIALPFVLFIITMVFIFMFKQLFFAVKQTEKMLLEEIPLNTLPIKRMDEVGHLMASFNKLITMLKSNQDTLKGLAHHDSLTGLPNRLLLSDRLQLEYLRADRNSTYFAILYLDLDGFKYINDTFGHDTGDNILIEVTNRFKTCVRESDTIARVGGDEFVIIISDLGNKLKQAESSSCEIASKCINILNKCIKIKENDLEVGVSIGISIGNGQSSLDELKRQSDEAMYKAKKNGKGQYYIG